MPVFMYQLYDEEQAEELKADGGGDPANIHDAIRIAKKRFPGAIMQIWRPGHIEYFTGQIDDIP